MAIEFHDWAYSRFIEIESSLRRNNFIEQIKTPIFLEANLATEIM